jgi:hypothetical protein
MYLDMVIVVPFRMIVLMMMTVGVIYVPIPLGSAATWCSSLPPFLLLLSVSSFLLFVLRSMTPPYLSSTPSLAHLS